MKRIESSLVIQRPIDQVLAYVIEPSNLPDWAPGFLEASSTSEGGIRVGSTSMRNTSFGGRRSESEHIVTEFEPNTLMAVSTRTSLLEIKELLELEAANGATRVTIAEEVSWKNLTSRSSAELKYRPIRMENRRIRSRVDRQFQIASVNLKHSRGKTFGLGKLT